MLRIGAKQSSYRPPENLFVGVMCFSEIGEERFFGHFVPSVHKAFWYVSSNQRLQFRESLGRSMYPCCPDIVSPILQASQSQRAVLNSLHRSTFDINSNVSALSTRDWCSGENIEVTRVALADHAPHMLV